MQAYNFLPAVNKGPTQLWFGYFLIQTEENFLPDPGVRLKSTMLNIHFRYSSTDTHWVSVSEAWLEGVDIESFTGNYNLDVLQLMILLFIQYISFW